MVRQSEERSSHCDKVTLNKRGTQAQAAGLAKKGLGEGCWGSGAPTHGGGAAALVAVSEELVQDDPEAPDIRLARENIVREGLRGVPGGCGQGRLEVRGGALDGTGAALGEGRRKVGAGGSFPSPGAQFT